MYSHAQLGSDSDKVRKVRFATLPLSATFVATGLPQSPKAILEGGLGPSRLIFRYIELLCNVDQVSMGALFYEEHSNPTVVFRLV